MNTPRARPSRPVALELTPQQRADLRRLWTEHAAALLAMLRRWCQNDADAADVLQELFLRLARAPRLALSADDPRAFLIVTARRIAIDATRRRQAERRREEQLAASGTLGELGADARSDADLRVAIARAVRSLAPGQRRVFEARFFQGLTLAEIARDQALSINTVASRFRYALDKIRAELRPYYDDMNKTQPASPVSGPTASPATADQPRLIRALEPKRVPSVAPGLEGIAALAPDDAYFDAQPIEVVDSRFDETSLPEISDCGGLDGGLVTPAEFTEEEINAEDGSGEATVIEDVIVEEPLVEEVIREENPVDAGTDEEGLIEAVVEDETYAEDDLVAEETDEDASAGETLEGEAGDEDLAIDELVVGEPLPPEWLGEIDPQIMICRVFDGSELAGIDTGDLPVAEHPEVNVDDFFNFGGEAESGEGVSEEGDPVEAIETEPSPGEGETDPVENDSEPTAEKIFQNYQTFLSNNPDWLASNGIGSIQLQVITPSVHVETLELANPGEAKAFDLWYAANYLNANSTGGETPSDGAVPDSTPEVVDNPSGGVLGGSPVGVKTNNGTGETASGPVAGEPEPQNNVDPEPQVAAAATPASLSAPDAIAFSTPAGVADAQTVELAGLENIALAVSPASAAPSSVAGFVFTDAVVATPTAHGESAFSTDGSSAAPADHFVPVVSVTTASETSSLRESSAATAPSETLIASAPPLASGVTGEVVVAHAALVGGIGAMIAPSLRKKPSPVVAG
jgi:RNA polymerase sigma-70 factor (ECF subfamily)